MKFLALTFLLFTLNIFSSEIKINTNSFDEANKKDHFLKFKGKSTKLGLITTEFIGLAKSYTINYEIKENKISTLEITIDKKLLDTDNKMRDEKMHTESLLAEKNNVIKVRLLKDITLAEVTDSTVNVSIKVIEKELIIPLIYQIKIQDDQSIITFNTKFSFIEAGIPNPSIMVAKVDEFFSIEGRIIIPKI
jgi:polyisoprenoid-binding protein YceI